MTFENVLHDLINTIKDKPPAPEIVVSRLKQLEGLAEQATASQALSALWDQAVCELLRYGGRIYGTRRGAGANFWAQLTTVNKLLPIEGIQYIISPGTLRPVWMGRPQLRVQPETLPKLLALTESASPAEKCAFEILSALIKKAGGPAAISAPGRTPMLGLVRFGFSASSSIVVLALRNLTKAEIGWEDNRGKTVCVIENPGYLFHGADRTGTISRSVHMDIKSMGEDEMLDIAKKILDGKGKIEHNRLKKIKENKPGTRGMLSGLPVQPGRSISGLTMEDKGTFGVELKNSNTNDRTRYGLTAMHVVTSVPISDETLAEQNIVRYPGLWDVLSHIDTAKTEYVVEPTAVNVERLRKALSHWLGPNIVGERLCGWIGVDESGYREDWALIRISSECHLQPSSITCRWDKKDILEQVRGWGLDISSLEVTGFRDPENGEIVFSDGARTSLTCGVVSMEMTRTYELASIFPDEAKAPEKADTCNHITIWAHGLEDFGAQCGDSGSAVFGRARDGNGVELVGLLVSYWADLDNGPLPEIEARCGLLVPATKLFEQMYKATGCRWTPA